MLRLQAPPRMNWLRAALRAHARIRSTMLTYSTLRTRDCQARDCCCRKDMVIVSRLSIYLIPNCFWIFSKRTPLVSGMINDRYCNLMRYL